MGPRKVINFHFSNSFSCKDENNILKHFTFWSWNIISRYTISTLYLQNSESKLPFRIYLKHYHISAISPDYFSVHPVPQKGWSYFSVAPKIVEHIYYNPYFALMYIFISYIVTSVFNSPLYLKYLEHTINKYLVDNFIIVNYKA